MPIAVPTPNLNFDPPDIQIRTSISRHLSQDVIRPEMAHELESALSSRKRWGRTANIMEAVAHVMLGLTSILSFCSGIFENKLLLFATGICSTLSLVLLKYAAYAQKECEERHRVVHGFLEYFDISPIPQIQDTQSSTVDQTE